MNFTFMLSVEALLLTQIVIIIISRLFSQFLKNTAILFTVQELYPFMLSRIKCSMKLISGVLLNCESMFYGFFFWFWFFLKYKF